MKQLVTETRKSAINILISTSYPETHPVFSKKEREEMVDGINTYYWVHVADNAIIDPNLEPSKPFFLGQQKAIKKEKRRATLKQLKQEKKERIAKYRAYVESIYYSKDPDIRKIRSRGKRFYDLSSVMTQDDITSASKLETMLNKLPKKLNKLSKSVQKLPSISEFIKKSENVILPKGSKNELE